MYVIVPIHIKSTSKKHINPMSEKQSIVLID